ncbi:MAG: glycoside hydrolase family 3 N-terminal domain-containing protein [Bacteroidota bacterium]
MRIIHTLFVLLILTLNLSAQEIDFPFTNTNLSIEERVEDLVNRLTLEEKVGQLMFDAPAIPRLGIPHYNWWNECLHGVARNGKATVFPQAIGMAATFDVDLMNRIGEAIALEGRAKFNENQKRGYTDRYSGLTYWSPNVNLFRDPRWGRGQETYGEDPFLISRLGVAFVNGLQGDGELLKVAAMAKHFAVHSGPEKLRHSFDAVVTKHDLWNTYLPAFEALVTEAKVEGVMGAYNRTNGDPCCAHPYLMQEVLREKWGFQGYFVSDCWAIQDFFEGHEISPDRKSAAAMALSTGCNLNCGNTYPELVEAIETGLTSESELDKNLKELLPTRFRLGLFDQEKTTLNFIELENVRKKEHIDLAYEAAAKSIVLLKNKDQTLPLDPNLRNLFVTGPTATDAQALLANYYGVSDNLTTFLEGIASSVSNHTAIRYVQGNLLDRPNINPMDWYSEEAEVADVTIACMGITQLLEGEEGEAIASPTYGDREYITLPPHQIEYLKLLRSKAKKLIVVITGGSAISIPEIHELADAILYAWYPGEQGGQALGDIIFGKINPSGKLPVTFVKSIDDLPPYEDYNMQGRTYRYMNVEPLYPFGFGLNYADIDYQNLTASSSELRKGGTLQLNMEVINSSEKGAEEVVQLYISRRDKTSNDPNYALKNFKRVSLDGNSSKNIKFILDEKAFSQYDEKGDLKLIKGTYDIYVSSSVPTERSSILGCDQRKSVMVEVK